MLLLFVLGLGTVLVAEHQPNPAFAALAVEQQGLLEGKESRLGIAASALWAVTTTAASNGSVNAMHDSFSPLGGMVAMFNMMLGEIVFGGVGAGLYGMLLFVLVTVFLAGLMIGRTPEYLGKKLDAREVRLLVATLLVMPVGVLVLAALGVSLPGPAASISNPDRTVWSQILYAYTSGTGNNGSAFAGFGAAPLPQPDDRVRHAAGPLRFHPARAGHRRQPRGQESCGDRPQQLSHLRPSVRDAVDPGDPDGRRADVPAGSCPRPYRRTLRPTAALLEEGFDERSSNGIWRCRAQSASSSFVTLCKPAMRQALLKLDPRQLIRSPVMLVVEIAAIFTTLLCFAPDAAVSRSVAAQIAICLWFTVLFANFAEALAEGRGKARADSL